MRTVKSTRAVAGSALGMLLLPVLVSTRQPERVEISGTFSVAYRSHACKGSRRPSAAPRRFR